MTKLIVVSLLAGLGMVVLNAAPNITGLWELDVVFDDSSIPGGAIDCVFSHHKDGRLSGHCMGAYTMGEVKEQNVRWRFETKSKPPDSHPPRTMIFTGVVNEAGTRITGTFTMNDTPGRFTASPHANSR